jgi:hypothetical protein
LSRAYPQNWFDTVEILAPIVGALKSKGQDQQSQRWLEGYLTKVLDGSCIDATERRIGELRKETAATLLGEAVAVQASEIGHRLFAL